MQMSINKKWLKILKFLLLFVLIGLAVWVIVVFKGNSLKILGTYYLLFARPEAFVVAAYALGQSPLLIFVQTWLFTTFMTFITWYLTGVVQKQIVKTQKAGKLDFLKKYKLVNWIINKHKGVQDWITKSREKSLNRILKKSPYLILIPFTFPFLPSIDTAAVVTAKIIKLPYAFWIFIAINAVKIIIIILGCINLWH
jgi:hypothetical protein